MALDVNKIAALLGAGGTDLGKNPDWRKTLAAILKNPQILTVLQAQASAATAPYQQYSPDTTYFQGPDVTKAINATKQQWEMMGSKYKNFIDDYAAKLAQTGGGPEYNKFYTDLISNPDKYAQQYGIDPTELASLSDQMDKQKKAFLGEQARVERENMKAFYSQRQKVGSAGDYMKKITGISGLENVVVTPEQLLAKRTSQVAKQLEKTYSPEQAAKLAKQYQGIIKKSLKGVNPLAYSLPSALKKTVLGG